MRYIIKAASPMRLRLTPLAFALATLSFVSPAVQAQSVAAAPQKQEAVTVTGNPLGGDEIVAPVTVLQGEKLLIQRESTLGATLDKQPGLSSTHFGPNADRPVIRGLDADRIRILGNGGASVDASSLSFDHALPIDPLAIERIEVLRGPAALLYGGNAVGGVVNVIDNRVPRNAVAGVSGALELRANSVSRGNNGSVLFEAGNGSFAVHADAFAREAKNTRIPGLQFTPERRAQAQAINNAGGKETLGGDKEILNSQARASGGALGGAFTWKDGFAGLAASSYRSNYGTVAEQGVSIDMKQDQFRFEGESRNLSGPFSGVSAKASNSVYQHTEFNGDTPATTFKSNGNELRLEGRHAALNAGAAKLEGVLGLQQENMKFSALGAEAFVPTTRTRVSSVFAYEELALPAAKFTFGLRSERSLVSSEGAVSGQPADRFGAPNERRFGLLSGSLSALLPINTQWGIGLQGARNVRAPTFYELYSDGVHAATGSYEQGDASLNKERSNSVELSLRYKDSGISSRINIYQTRFTNYISLFDTRTRFVELPDTDVPLFRFIAVPARFTGFEWEGKARVVQAPYTLDISGKWDLVRAMNTQTNEPLPRIAPMRVGLGFEAGQGPFLGGADVQFNAKPKVPAGEYQSDAYTLLSAHLSYKFPLGENTSGLAFVKLNNLSNVAARPAASLLREVSPLAARGLELGVRLSF
jgi:iron complex outermembrane recepter protein